MKCEIIVLSFLIAIAAAGMLDRDRGLKALDRAMLFQMLAVEEDAKDIWSDCGTPNDIGTINKVTIIPDPPRSGKDIKVEADVTLSETVTNGNIHASVKFSFLPRFSKTIPLCGKLTELTCPLNTGEHSLEFQGKIPHVIFGGRVHGKAVAETTGGKQIFCIDLDFYLS